MKKDRILNYKYLICVRQTLWSDEVIVIFIHNELQ